MRNDIPIEQKIISEAEFGVFFLRHRISNQVSENLRKQGFKVELLSSSLRIYYISWKSSVVRCTNIWSLDETSNKYTLAQKAWIISKKCSISVVDYLKNKKEQV